MAAVICMAGPMVLPVGMVPISLANLAIYLTLLLSDKKRAMISIAVYLLIGLTGVPVFAGFTGGAGKLLGPTGGYLIGYLVLGWVSGTVLKKIDNGERNRREKGNKKKNIKQMLALAAGTLALYIFGTLWLMLQSKISFGSALLIGAVPFILPDILKILLSICLADSIKRRAGFLFESNSSATTKESV